jgi:hypothetical protein
VSVTSRNKPPPAVAVVGRAADRLAIGASAACLVHCLALPLAIAVAPALARWADASESLHLLIFFLAVPISAVAMLAGFRRHGLIIPLLLAVTGLAMIGVGALAGFGLAVEIGATVVGSLILAAAHLWNLRAGRSRHEPMPERQEPAA